MTTSPINKTLDFSLECVGLSLATKCLPILYSKPQFPHVLLILKLLSIPVSTCTFAVLRIFQKTVCKASESYHETFSEEAEVLSATSGGKKYFAICKGSSKEHGVGECNVHTLKWNQHLHPGLPVANSTLTTRSSCPHDPHDPSMAPSQLFCSHPNTSWDGVSGIGQPTLQCYGTGWNDHLGCDSHLGVGTLHPESTAGT